MKPFQKSLAVLFFAIMANTVATQATAQTWTGSASDESIVFDSYFNNIIPPLNPQPSPYNVVHTKPPGFYQTPDGDWEYEEGAICRICTAWDVEDFNRLANDPVCCGFGIRIPTGTFPSGFITDLVTGATRTPNVCRIAVFHMSSQCIDEESLCYCSMQSVIMTFTTMAQ